MEKPKVTKKTLPESELRYRRLFEAAHLGILILDCATRVITDANPFMAKLTGYSRTKLIGKRISDFNLFEDDLSGRKIFADLEHKYEASYENIALIDAKGQRKIVEINAHAYKEDSRRLVQCTIRDLTEKRSAQRELFEANQRLEALMNALPVGVTFSLDPKCEHIRVNPYMERMMEMAPGSHISATPRATSVTGQMLRHYIDGKEIKPKDLTMQQAIAKNREVGPFEIEVALPSGKHWLMEATGAPIRDGQGKVVGAVAVHTDLTERKKAEAAEKFERMVEQEKLKMDFIADAAHELRTPLAIIKGNVDLALHARMPVKEALDAINVEILHLTSLLSDLALLTTEEKELRRKVTVRKVDIAHLVENVVKRHESFAQKKNIKLHIDAIPKATVAGDEHYLERLFSNIISNAVSYGKENGNVWVEGKKTGKIIQFTIRDNGMGISEKDLPHIFERFYRADASRSKDYGGSGLGLAIVKWIAEAHCGLVTATSTEGEGSTFTVILPLAKV